MSEFKGHFHDITQEVTHNLAYMRSELPDVMKGFHDLGRAATHAGALDAKTKELIAVVLGVAAHCDPCIGFHVKAYVRHGGTKRELAEALGMAEQQIQRYEANDYRSTSLARLCDVANALGVTIAQHAELNSSAA